jgi:hypothetical protein
VTARASLTPQHKAVATASQAQTRIVQPRSESVKVRRLFRLRRSPVLIAAMMSAGLDSHPFGNAWFSKRKAVNRIDALIALAMAVGAATTVAAYVPTSPWDDPTFSLAGT